MKIWVPTIQNGGWWLKAGHAGGYAVEPAVLRQHHLLTLL